VPSRPSDEGKKVKGKVSHYKPGKAPGVPEG
jgi:hypothetical protein